MSAKKIAVIDGGELCQGTLRAFSEDMAEELSNLGNKIHYLSSDISTESLIELCSDGSYDVVIAFQNNCFTLSIDGKYIGALSNTPKFNLMFDSPTWARCILKHSVNQVTYLYHDEQYVDFVKQYYANTKVCHFPLAGRMGAEMTKGLDEREFDLSFIGYYNDYRLILAKLLNELRGGILSSVAEEFFTYLLTYPQMNSGDAFFTLIREKNWDIAKEDALTALEILYPVECAAFSYWRERVIETLLKFGTEIHVFSDSWRAAPFAGMKNLHIHGEVSCRSALDVMAHSKLSLNVFSGHKGGMTERIANIMMNGAVCVTDTSSYLKKHFTNGRDILMFDLKDMYSVAEKITELLKDDVLRTQIASNGFSIASEQYQWKNSAQRLLDILDQAGV